jgi:general secretion pathway protein G
MIVDLRQMKQPLVRRTVSFSTSPRRGRIRAIAAGMTLLELIIACAIMLILATSAVPMARVMVVRRKEEDLRIALRQIRTAIDRYKDSADQNKIQVQAGTEGYPPDLATLVNGVQMTGGQVPGGALLGGTSSSSLSAGKQKIHFLARIPVDPMTGSTDWGLRSVQDDTDSTSWGGQNVFDVYTKSGGTAMNGTRYTEW